MGVTELTLIGVLIVSGSLFAPRTESKVEKCLPPDIQITDIVSVEPPSQDGKPGKSVTVKQRLLQLKARCRGQKLVDARGREIRFYRLTGCWGNPPADYLEILENQRREIENLKKRYTVIEMTCNPSGKLIQ